MPETAPPPTKPSFTQLVASAAPKDAAELKARAEAAKSGTPPPAAPAPPPEPPKPAATAPAVPAATTDPDDEILSGKRNPKSEDFRRVKTRAQEAQKERDELKGKWEAANKELDEAKKAPKHNAELIKQIEKERDEYKSKHDAFIVQFTPEFHQKFDAQIGTVISGLKTIVPEAEANKLAEILQLPDGEYKRKMIAEVTEGMDSFTVSEIANANRDIRRISQERKAQIDNANKTLTGIAEERQKQSREIAERQSKALEETLKVFTEGEKAIPIFKKRDGDEAWNKGVEERIRVARVIQSGQFESDEDRAEAAAWAAAAPGILQDYQATVIAKDAEIAQLKSTLEKLQGASPGVTGAQPSGGATPKRGGFMEKMSALTPQ